MKNILLLFLLFAVTITIVGCKEKEFKVDGRFLAYETTVSRDAPMVTFVIVTITDGEISGFELDARQGKRTETQLTGVDTPDDDSDDTFEYSFAWNEKTKVELGDDYNMVTFGGADKEWYAQAELIESHWLENGYDAPLANYVGEIADKVAGVTIKDSNYSVLVAKAVENARAGLFTAIYTVNDDLLFARMIVDGGGNFSQLVIDTLKGSPDGYTFSWGEKTKQQLGSDYGMVENSDATLEWFEQVNLITKYIMYNGWDDNLQPVDSRGVSTDGTNIIEEVAGVTIRTGNYFELLEILFDYVSENKVDGKA